LELLNKESHRALSYSILEMHCEIIVLLSALWTYFVFWIYSNSNANNTLFL